MAQVWGTVVRADRHEADAEMHRLIDDESGKVVYQISTAMARSVERCGSQREAERKLREARTRPVSGGKGTLFVDEPEETHPRSGTGIVEKRSFAIDERIIPRRGGGGGSGS